MSKVYDFLERHMFKLVGVPFVANLLMALADGHISEAEYHSLSSGERLGELIILGVVMSYLKLRKK